MEIRIGNFSNFFSKIISTQACDLLAGLIPNREEHGLLQTNHLNKLIVFALMWSAGALLELDDRAKMEEHMRTEKCLDLPKIPDGSNETIFEYVVNDAGIKRYLLLNLLLNATVLLFSEFLIKSLLAKSQINRYCG